MEKEFATVQLIADQGMLSMLLEAITEKLERWPGGDPDEQEALTKLQSLLFAASLEFLMLD